MSSDTFEVCCIGFLVLAISLWRDCLAAYGAETYFLPPARKVGMIHLALSTDMLSRSDDHFSRWRDKGHG